MVALGEADLLDDAVEVHARRAEERIGALNFENFTGDREANGREECGEAGRRRPLRNLELVSMPPSEDREAAKDCLCDFRVGGYLLGEAP